MPALGNKLDVERAADLTAKAGIGSRFGAAQTVVEMERAQSSATLGPMGPEKEQERKGIGPAGEADGPRAAARRGAGPRKDGGVKASAGERCGERSGERGPVGQTFSAGFHVGPRF